MRLSSLLGVEKEAVLLGRLFRIGELKISDHAACQKGDDCLVENSGISLFEHAVNLEAPSILLLHGISLGQGHLAVKIVRCMFGIVATLEILVAADVFVMLRQDYRECGPFRLKKSARCSHDLLGWLKVE